MSGPTLHLEFGNRRPPLSGVSLGALAVALLLLLSAAWQASRTLAEQSAQRQALQALERPPPRTQTAARSTARPDPVEAAQAQYARQTVRNLNTPWAELLRALESAPTNVALLVVEPSAGKRSVAITAEASNAGDMLDYIAALHADGRLTRIALVSHQLQEQAPGAPLRFQLRANWGEQP
jgi:hypothetical protein